MKNQMITVNEKSFFTRVKRWFYGIKKKIFGKNNSEIVQNMDIEIPKTIDSNATKNKFINDIKFEDTSIYTINEKKDFLKELDGNVELLSKLSIDRLRKLSKYYNDVINKNEITIKKLKADM